MAKAKTSKNKQQAELLGLYRQTLSAGESLVELDRKVNYFLKRAAVSEREEVELDKKIKRSFWQRLPKIVRLGANFVPVLLIVIGLSLALSAAWPLLSYYLPANDDWEMTLLSPIPSSQLMAATPLLSAQAKVQGDSAFQDSSLSEPIILDQEIDFTDLSNWFDLDFEDQVSQPGEAIEYRLDIPEINVSNAKVRLGGTDLNQSLIQYPGTALPGQLGSPVIFGHSVLRQFYNPSEKNPRRYSSIFSKIMTLNRGDKIFLTQDNVKFTYVVQDKTEVKPEDTFILAQRVDAHQLKLVTCTPEGTTLRRGVVTAQLVKE